MRFLAVCSATCFWTRCTFSEDSSNNSYKKSKNFFQQFPSSNYPKPQKNTVAMHFIPLCTGSFRMSGETLFFNFYKGFEWNIQKVILKKFAYFIIAVTGDCIGCEGERQKYSKYINDLEYFVFFPPQSWIGMSELDIAKLIPFNHCA